MKTFMLLVFLLAASAAFASDTPHELAYEKENAVWVSSIDGRNPKKISQGQSPDLSPDGRKLAFNTVQAEGQPSHRQIAVADLITGRVTILKNIPSDNCMEPVWSPDGKTLLFYFYVNGEMRIGLINANGSGFRDVQKLQKYKSYWAVAWAADGRSFFGEDMESVYQLDLNANVLKKWKIEKIIPHGGMSGDSRFHASADGETLLMDVAMDEKARKGWDDAPAAIWLLDLTTAKTTRLTPGTLYAWDCHWLTPDTILCASQPAGSQTQSIYRMSLDGRGKDLKLLVRDARLPSAAP